MSEHVKIFFVSHGGTTGKSDLFLILRGYSLELVYMEKNKF
jgi:hypothetical protein